MKLMSGGNLMKISKSIYASLDTKVWKLRRYKDFFFCYNSVQKSICKVQGNTLQRAFEYPQDEISCFDIYDDMLLAGTKHGELVLWNIDKPKALKTFSLNQNIWIFHLSFLDSDVLALEGNLDELTLIYSLRQGKIIDTIPTTTSYLWQARHQDYLIFDSQNGLLAYHWQSGNSEEFALSDKVVSPIFSDDGRLIVANNLDDLPNSHIELLVYERDTMRLVQRIDTLSSSEGYHYLSFDKYLVCTMADSAEIGFWDIETGENILREKFSTFWLNHLSYDAERRELVIGAGWEKILGEYNIEIWKLDF
jgi:hypothetical protein